jgi:diguanylate cyclase (GGDEF)-like protein
MTSKRVLVVDQDSLRRKSIIMLLKDLHFRAIGVADGLTAIDAIEAKTFGLVICDYNLAPTSAQDLCEYVQEFVKDSLPFILVVSEEEEELEKICQQVGADACLKHPLERHALKAICQSMIKVKGLENRTYHLEAENLHLRKSISKSAPHDPDTNFYNFEFFKKVILIEIKKAQRYNYPMAIVLLALDKHRDLISWLNPKQRKTLYTQVGQAVTSSIRDIDIPVKFIEDKILVVMPHTTNTGAAVVADRIRDRINNIKPPGSLTQLTVTASFSVASTRGGEETGFGKIIAQAMQGIKDAKKRGGNVVLVTESGQETTERDRLGSSDGKLGPRVFFV